MGDIYNIGVLFQIRRNYSQEFAGNVWTKEGPTCIGIFLYSILTPTICSFGIVGNLICLIVLSKEEFTCSFFVYLRVLAAADFSACCVIFISGLARGILWWREGWASYDALVSIPLGSFFSYLSTFATVFVTADRVVYLQNPLRRIKPRFCKRRVAKKIMCVNFVISFICALPYCFIYEFNFNKILETTNFYKSKFYAFYNWFDLTMFAIFPFVLLTIGNSMLMLSLKNVQKIRLQTGKAKRMKNQFQLTLTLVSIVFLYLIGEVPTHLTARKTAANLLFGGDHQMADYSEALEISRQITTVLNAVHLASKFILYCLFCPKFCRALKKTVTGKTEKKESKEVEARNIPITRLFLIEKYVDRRLKLDIIDLGFMNVLINNKAAQELPRII